MRAMLGACALLASLVTAAARAQVFYGTCPAPSPVMAGARLTVFAPGPGARLLHAFYDPAQSAWTPWLPIERACDPDGYYTMGPASALMHGDRLTVFATGTTRMRVVDRFFDPDSREWTAWAPLEGREEIVSAPGAVVAGARLVVFATDRFGALVHRYLEGGKWSRAGSPSRAAARS